MEHLSEDVRKLVSLKTEGVIEAIQNDLEIALDSSRHNSWLTAVATAGLGLLLTQFKAALDRSFLPPQIAYGLLLVAGVLLFLALVLSAVQKRALKKGMLFYRMDKTYQRRQELDLVTEAEHIDLEKKSLVEVEAVMSACGYLKPEAQVAYAKLVEDIAALPKEKWLRPALEALIGAGYLLLAVVFVPSLAP